MKFETKNKEGQRIVGIIDKPEHEGKFPAVIVCHGFKGYKEQPHIESIAESLVKKNIIAVRFDATNHRGESDGEIINVSVFHYVKDMKSVLDYLESLEFVDKDKLGVVGHSFGSRAGTLLTAQDPRVKCFVPTGLGLRLKQVLESRHGEEAIKDWKKKGWMIIRENSNPNISHKVGYQYYEEDIPNEIVDSIKKIKVPILFLLGSEDEYISKKEAKELFKLAKDPKELVIMEGFPHTWKKPEDCRKVGEIVADWFKKNL